MDDGSRGYEKMSVLANIVSQRQAYATRNRLVLGHGARSVIDASLTAAIVLVAFAKYDVILSFVTEILNR